MISSFFSYSSVHSNCCINIPVVSVFFPWQLIRVVNLKPQERELSSSVSSHDSRPSVQMTRIPVVIDTIMERSLTGCQGKQLRNM